MKLKIKIMKTINEFMAVINFIGDDMTDDQAVMLMDQAKEHLSISEIEVLYSNCSNAMYTELDQYNAEMGGLNRY